MIWGSMTGASAPKLHATPLASALCLLVAQIKLLEPRFQLGGRDRLLPVAAAPFFIMVVHHRGPDNVVGFKDHALAHEPLDVVDPVLPLRHGVIDRPCVPRPSRFHWRQPRTAQARMPGHSALSFDGRFSSTSSSGISTVNGITRARTRQRKA